jgi:ribonuclease Y
MALDTNSVLYGFAAGIIGAAIFAVLKHRGTVAGHRRELGIAQREADLRTRELRAKDEEELRARNARADAELARAEASRAEAEARSAQAFEAASSAAKERDELAREKKNFTREALRVAGLSPVEARKAALEAIRTECEEDAKRLRTEILGKREEELREEARRVLVDTMQRLAPTVVHETGASAVHIPDESMKGRLIGREGRNIKAFETLTGTTLMIDETPESVFVSSFDPVRREIARVALESLVKDGRIHPASIESFVESAREQVLSSAHELGAEAADKAGVSVTDNETLELLGKLHFRLSVNQNTLDHSVEVAHLAAMMAAELGLDPAPARRAGLLHDIGKAMNDDTDLGHAGAGAALLRRLGDDPRVVNAVAAHHGEVEPESIYAPLLRLADGISASRPGARSSTLEGYTERVRGLETLAKSFPGVIEAHAIQAGREVRVIVSPAHLSEEDSAALARKIRVRIEEEMHYPGTVKIVLIREQRFHEEAR